MFTVADVAYLAGKLRDGGGELPTRADVMSDEIVPVGDAAYRL